MIETAIEHEPALRFVAFLGVFALVAAWEALAPRRVQRYTRGRRWPNNLGLLAVDALVVRLVAPGAAIAVAINGDLHGWGLLNTASLPAWAKVIAAVVALDLAIYFQHVLFHAVPLLWRLHRVHHTDPEFDVTTGTRFHPLEIVLSLGIKCAVIGLLGAPPLAVLIFEMLLNVTAMFNHSNGRLPLGLDRRLRWIVVTPDMHRVHHSVVQREADSNFGFSLPWWDRLFGTYRAQPAASHAAMAIGVEGLGGPEELPITRLLTQPFRNADADAAQRRPAEAPAGDPFTEGVSMQEETGLLYSGKARRAFVASRAAIDSGGK
jgi:sterol desaturase/sphingolipid hydroxylase (fatty acid hydroxylase superfamily)